MTKVWQINTAATSDAGSTDERHCEQTGADMVTSYLGSRVVVLDIGEAVRLAYRSLPYLEVDYDDVFGMDEGSLRGYHHVSLVDPRNTAARRREARENAAPPAE